MMSINIREITYDDTDLIVNWRNKGFVRSKFLFREDFTNEMHQQWMQEKVDKGLVKQFIIEVDKMPVGSVFLKDVDKVNNKAEFGIFIGEENYLGKGIGSEATRLILDFAHDRMHLHKVYLRVLSDNFRAINSYKKNGFTVEANLRDELFIDKKYLDIVLMGKILED